MVILISATGGHSAPLAHVANRTESVHVLLQVSLIAPFPLNTRCIYRYIYCVISKLCNIIVTTLPLALAILTLAVSPLASHHKKHLEKSWQKKKNHLLLHTWEKLFFLKPSCGRNEYYHHKKHLEKSWQKKKIHLLLHTWEKLFF